MPKLIPIKHYPRSKLLSTLPTSLQLFTISEVAIILSTNTKMVTQWLDEGLLKSVHLGNDKNFLRIRALDLENFIDEQIRSGQISPPPP